MTPAALAEIIQYAVLPWLFLPFAVVILKMLTGDINTAGLLCSRAGGPIDPERVTTVMSSAIGWRITASVGG